MNKKTKLIKNENTKLEVTSKPDEKFDTDNQNKVISTSTEIMGDKSSATKKIQTATASMNNDSRKVGTQHKKKSKKRRNKSGAHIIPKVNNTGAVVDNNRTGAVSTSNEYQIPKNTDGVGPVVSNQVAISIDISDLKKNAVISSDRSDANAYNNKVIPSKAFNLDTIDLQSARSISSKMKIITSVGKSKKILTPKTTVLSYTFEEYQKKADTKAKFTLQLLNTKEKDYNYGLRPEVISVAFTFNFSGINPELVRLIRNEVVLKGQTLESVESKASKLKVFEAKVKKDDYKMIKVKNPTEELDKFKTTTDSRASFFNGYIPEKINDPKGDLHYKATEFDMTLNDVTSDKVPEHYFNDVSTISTYKSFKVLLSNIINIVQNNPEYYQFRGLARNVPELTHIIYQLINLRTFWEIIFYSISTVQGRQLKIAQKLGIVDGTFKHFFGSRITPSLQNVLKVLAGYLSEIPYNKRVIEEYKNLTKWGTVNDRDYDDELNSIINVVTILAGDFPDKVGTSKDNIIVRDNVAAPAFELPNYDLLQTTLSALKNFYHFQPAYLTGEHYDNDNKMAFNGAVEDDNASVPFRDLFSVSPTRLTDCVYNLITSFNKNAWLLDTYEEFFRSSALFFTLFKASGIFDGTDFAIDTMQVPVLGDVSDEPITKFHSMSWFRGFHLGSPNSQYQLLDADELIPRDFIPSWRLFLEEGKTQAEYLNWIGFFTVGSSWLPSEKPHHDYYNNGYYNPIITLKTNLNSVNLLDCMVIPFVPFNDSIKAGWNYGTLLRGETYVFDPKYGITLGAEQVEEGDVKKDEIQFFPMMFEWASLPHEAVRQINERPTTPVFANHPEVKYYVTQNWFPFLDICQDRSAKEFTLFALNDWNFLPNYWWKHKGEEYHGLGYKTAVVWEVLIAQLFRNKVFAGLHPLARGRSYLDVPTRSMCKLGQDD